MKTHTAGEWQRACDSYGKVQHSRKYDCVYTTLKGHDGEKLVTIASRIENGCDADLIEAAPELLVAAKAALANIKGLLEGDDLPSTVVRDALSAAIEKAERNHTNG